MSRISRIAFLAILVLALTVVAGFDLRLALANRDLAIETGAVLDQHERHPNGIRVVTDRALDEHERRASAPSSANATTVAPAVLDEHERRASRQAPASGTSTVPAALDEHERRASSR